jgi:TctA family transporter
MLLSRGSFMTFVTRPISGGLLALIAVFVVWQLVAFVRSSGKMTRSAAVAIDGVKP